MKRGFLKNNRKPLLTSGSSATHQAVWESLKQRASAPTKVYDVTELLKKPMEASTPTNAAERTIGIIAGPGQSLPAPSFEDKNKSVLIPNLIHRIPSLATTQGRESSSFCLLWSSTLEKITNAPGYPSTLPKTLPDLFVIKSAPNMGLGLFAKHDIKVSELVLAERPLLVVPPMVPIVAESPEQRAWSEAEMRRHGNELYEEKLGKFMNFMKKEDANAFRNLENRHREDGYNLFGIVLTNGYPINFDEADETLQYLAIANQGSRINHSCTPNLSVEFDTASFSLQYTAIQDIKAGEQLFYSYCNPMRAAKERQVSLDRYKFVCRCTACENATPDSDKMRERYGIDVKTMSRVWKEVLLGSEFKGDSLCSLLNIEKEMMKEGLDFWMPFPLLLDAIAQVYIKLGDQMKAGQYKTKLARYKPVRK